MKRNVGRMDSFLRVMFGIPFLVYGIMHNSLLGLIGVALIATAFIGFCGLYTLINCDTCKRNEQGTCEI